MTIPTIFETCRPRADVLAGRVSDADFAADLASVVAGRASAEYLDPAAKRAIELTPRMWQSLFADAPLRSDLGPHHHEPPSH